MDLAWELVLFTTCLRQIPDFVVYDFCESFLLIFNGINTVVPLFLFRLKSGDSCTGRNIQNFEQFRISSNTQKVLFLLIKKGKCHRQNKNELFLKRESQMCNLLQTKQNRGRLFHSSRKDLQRFLLLFLSCMGRHYQLTCFLGVPYSLPEKIK